MDLRTHYPFSLLRYGFINSYPSLDKDIRTDVVVLGAGISGALAAYHLNQKGIPGVVLDKRHVAMGSTAASTSFIQYEIDVPLHELAKKMGSSRAVRSYEISLNAVRRLEEISRQLKGNFTRRTSLQLASLKSHMPSLGKEWTARRQCGFDVELLGEKELRLQYGIKAPGALLSTEAGELDAYQFSHLLLSSLDPSVFPVYDHTHVVNITHGKRTVTLTTERGNTVTCKKLVIACGYESGKYLSKKMESLRCTFAFASEPTGKYELWKDNCLIWETASPYNYLRTTNEGRVMMGGQDIPFVSLNRQVELLPSKTNLLVKKFKKLFPGNPIRADFSWAGAFATTKDGLPYIGSVPERPHTFFALGYGGNGITFSLVAAEMLGHWISGQQPKDMDLFSFNRR